MFFNDATTAFTAATFAAIEKEVSSMFFSESSSTTTMTTQDAGNDNNNSLWTWVTVLPLGYYSFLSVYSNVLDCYNFFAAWNMISGTHRIDLEILHFHKNNFIQRSLEMDRVLDNRLYSEVLVPTTLACETSTTTTSSKECPICLTDFCADDMVSSCKDQPTCQHLFHKGCLEAWLQKQQSCPCCRYEILPIAPPQHPLLR